MPCYHLPKTPSESAASRASGVPVLAAGCADHAGEPCLEDGYYLYTSFNENAPIVYRPAEALDCFLWTRMDVLVLGDYVVQKH
jgi:hypothetical protein